MKTMIISAALALVLGSAGTVRAWQEGTKSHHYTDSHWSTGASNYQSRQDFRDARDHGFNATVRDFLTRGDQRDRDNPSDYGRGGDNRHQR